MAIADGFPGQKLIVLPRPLVAAALERPGTSHLVVSDCGYFPEARAHEMSRPGGIDQAVVMVCVRGRGWAHLDDQRHAVGAGQVLVLPPSIGHAYGADPEDPWTVWWVHVAGPDVPELLRSSGITAASPVRELADPFRAIGLIEEAVRALEHDTTTLSVLSASGAAWHLLTVLSADSSIPGAASTTMDRARDHLRSHLTERISVAELAAMSSLSTSHFAALFRQRFGVPVLRYQTELRMARARELLDTTDRPVARIAADVGYRDPFYFSRQFSSVHGVTPRDYRAQHKG